ncbi:MAG: hypothetical protein ACOCUR_00065 [Nanoarchaeota archaeon]
MKRLILFFMLFMLSLSIASTAYEPQRSKMRLQTLDNYVVTLNIDGEDNAKITQSFDIVNRHREPIIPGRAKLVLFGGLDPEDIVISIGGSRRMISEENVILEDGNNVIYYEIWRPIDPLERLNVEVNFNSEVDPQGLMFKQLNLNFGEPDVEIEKMALSVSFPANNRLTYSNLGTSKIDGNSVLIEIPSEFVNNEDESILVEYSSLPLPVMPFNGYWLWLLLIVMSAGIMMMKIFSRREVGSKNAA